MSVQALFQADFSCRAIARQLDFDISTIYREINRSKAESTALARSYKAALAQSAVSSMKCDTRD